MPSHLRREWRRIGCGHCYCLCVCYFTGPSTTPTPLFSAGLYDLLLVESQMIDLNVFCSQDKLCSISLQTDLNSGISLSLGTALHLCRTKNVSTCTPPPPPPAFSTSINVSRQTQQHLTSFLFFQTSARCQYLCTENIPERSLKLVMPT